MVRSFFRAAAGVAFGAAAGALLAGCATDGRAADTASAAAVAVHAQHLARLDSLEAALAVLQGTVEQLEGTPVSAGAAQRAFADARTAFKRAEALLELYTPGVADALNGPALPEHHEAEGTDTIEPPDGFQVLEEKLFPEPALEEREDAVLDVRRMRAHLVRARQVVEATGFTDANVFDALRQELARIATLGLSGFDSPVASQAMREGREALRGVRETLAPYAAMAGRSPAWGALMERLDVAEAAFAATDDASADRLALLAEHLLPTARALAALRDTLGVALPADRRVWRAGSASPFEADAFDAAALADAADATVTDARVALGRALFFDPALSADGTRSCASCHQPERAFTDGLARSATLPGRHGELRNAPTVINAALQGWQFADARAATLEAQVLDVVGNADEMHGSLPAVAARLASDPARAAELRAAFAGTADTVVTERALRRAIAAYLRSLVRLDAPFDRYVRGDRSAMTPEQVRGANVYLGKAKCGTCHFLPLTSGYVPPAFAKHELEVIGVPATPRWSNARVDPDLGKAGYTRLPLHRHAFKTPGIRNAALTAPYMHNGVYRTLEEVVRFYDVGGGAGIGIALEHQTLPTDSLHLSAEEQRTLVAFLGALTDTTGTTARPVRTSGIAMRR